MKIFFLLGGKLEEGEGERENETPAAHSATLPTNTSVSTSHIGTQRPMDRCG